jgi:hypothetical protein
LSLGPEQRLEAVHDDPGVLRNIAKGLMMSDYRGHDRPFPQWFPYAIGGTLTAALLIYMFAIAS